MRSFVVVFVLLFSKTIGELYEDEESDFEIDLVPQIPNTVDYTSNDLCRKENELYTENLNNYTLWAYEMLDASMKSTSGILEGDTFQLGNFEQCLNINGPFETQYCLVDLNINLPHINSTALSFDYFNSILHKFKKSEKSTPQSLNKIHIGLCFPASCSGEDIQYSLNKYLETYKSESYLGNLNATYDVVINKHSCQSNANMPSFNVGPICFAIICITLFLMTALASYYDHHLAKQKKAVDIENTASDIILAFSIRRNYNELFETQKEHSELAILNGVRCLAILLIIICDKLEMFHSAPLMNSQNVYNMVNTALYYIILKTDLLVDTFFVLSGMLLSYGILKKFEIKNVNPLKILLLRYIRITPLLAFVIFYKATIYLLSGFGPIWNMTVKESVVNCQKNWWINLLYLNNYLKTDEQCFFQTWYLACDFHFFILGLILIFALKKNTQVGYGLLITSFAASIVTPFVVAVIYNLPPTLEFNFDKLSIYITSFARAGPYLIGLFGGILFYNFKSESKTIQRNKSHIIACVSVSAMLLSVLWLALFYNNSQNSWFSAVYVALHRNLWAIGNVGLLITGNFGYSTYIKTLFSCPRWIPLAKLSYAMFLTHTLLQYFEIGNSVTSIYMTPFKFVYSTIPDVIISMFFAFILYILIENPIRQISRKLLAPKVPINVINHYEMKEKKDLLKGASFMQH